MYATDKLCVNNRDETNTIRISEIYLTVPFQSGYWTMKLLDIVMVGEKGNWTRPRHYGKGNMLCVTHFMVFACLFFYMSGFPDD